MKNKIWIIIAVIVVIVAGAMFYLMNRSRTLSPPGSASQTSGALTVSVTYSRPSVKGRVIFGTEEQKALQPYGKYWRLGANESTEITFNIDALFNGKAVKAGTYRMYAIPGAESFEIVLNTELGEWGAFEPDTSKDLLRTQIPVEKIGTPVEQYTITLDPKEQGVDVIFEWSDTRLVLPVNIQ